MRSNKFEVFDIFTGSSRPGYKFSNPLQAINYVECHDNHTYYDFGKYVLGLNDKEIHDSAKVALGLTILSEGVPFIHAGQEFLRTKRGVENSYKSSDVINRINYSRRNSNLDLVNMVRDLIKIRKKYKCFRLAFEDEVSENVVPYGNLWEDEIAKIHLKNDKQELIVAIKYNSECKDVYLQGYTMIFDSNRLCEVNEDNYLLFDKGVYVFLKK